MVSTHLRTTYLPKTLLPRFWVIEGHIGSQIPELPIKKIHLHPDYSDMRVLD